MSWAYAVKGTTRHAPTARGPDTPPWFMCRAPLLGQSPRRRPPPALEERNTAALPRAYGHLREVLGAPSVAFGPGHPPFVSRGANSSSTVTRASTRLTSAFPVQSPEQVLTNDATWPRDGPDGLTTTDDLRGGLAQRMRRPRETRKRVSRATPATVPMEVSGCSQSGRPDWY